MPTVPTDPDLNRNELIGTPLRGDYMGMKCLGLPRTVLEADFLVSMPKSETHRRSDVTLSMKNMFPSFDIFIRKGCGCNCGCTLLHIGNVSSIWE